MDELNELSKQINKLTKQSNWTERNKLAAKWRELFAAHDFGWQKGQEVEYWDMKWKRGKIKEIRSNMEILISDIIVSATSIRDLNERQEQMTLF